MSYTTPRIHELAKKCDDHSLTEDPDVDIRSTWWVPSPEEWAEHGKQWALRNGRDQDTAEKFGYFYANLHNDGNVDWDSRMTPERAMNTEYRLHLKSQSLHPSRRPIGLSI